MGVHCYRRQTVQHATRMGKVWGDIEQEQVNEFITLQQLKNNES